MQLNDRDLSELNEEELLRFMSIHLLNDLKEARKSLNQNSHNSPRPPGSEAPSEHLILVIQPIPLHNSKIAIESKYNKVSKVKMRTILCVCFRFCNDPCFYIIRGLNLHLPKKNIAQGQLSMFPVG